MKDSVQILFILSIIIFSAVHSVNGQKKYTISYDSAFCKASYINEYSRILPKVKLNPNPSAKLESTDFIVDYQGFSPEAKEAFAYAVSVWDALIDTPVPIHIEAKWITLGQGVLGNAIWGQIEDEIVGGIPGTVYPITVAEKILGTPINTSDKPDIRANFNNDFDWYYGTDGNTPTGKIDLVSVVMHEIGHGLGISDSYSDDPGGQRGFFGFNGLPMAYDKFVINGNGEVLADNYQNNSLPLHIQLISEALFFKSPIAAAASNGSFPRLYAPNPFNGGSSIAHLDESTYPPGNENSLMSPQVGFAEAIHDPGPIIMGMLADLGWVHTYIDHNPVADQEDLNSSALVSAVIQSDTDLQLDKLVLHYSSDGFSSEDISVILNPDGGDSFSASIPGTGQERTISYYLEAMDSYDRVYLEPSSGHYSFLYAPDNLPPQITMDIPQFIFASEDSIILEAEVTDGYGIEAVSVRYKINDGSFLELPMEKHMDKQNTYTGSIKITGLGLREGDQIFYTINATDASSNANVGILPSSGEFILPIREFGEAVSAYTNTFNEPSNDFVGWRLSITQPENFINPGIHSDHPYRDGSNANLEDNFYITLLKPIILKSEEAFIDFDEIVLVEPRRNGEPYGGEFFYDYVIVEGSKDFGETWKPLIKGYDSRDQQSWLDAFEDSFTGFDSDAVGVPTLYKHRQIDMLSTGNFVAGDEIAIRFRLFVDQSAHGWGWAIDNVAIQDEILSTNPTEGTNFSVFPNPLNQGPLTIQLEEILAENSVLTIYNVLGVQVLQMTVSGSRPIIQVDQLNSGSYTLIISSKNRIRTARLLIKK